MFYIDYLDYLDYLISGSTNFEVLKTWLRYDLLIFGRCGLCLSISECVKKSETTDLLMELDDFWANGILQIQINGKYESEPLTYFTDRVHLLEKSMPEEKLLKHFEFISYESSRKNTFFKSYLPRHTCDTKSTYLTREKNTDSLLEKEHINYLNPTATQYVGI